MALATIIRSQVALSAPGITKRILPEPPVAGYTRRYRVNPVQSSPMATWLDETGNSDLSQGTAANQPTVVTDSGVPAVLFDGVNDSMSCTFANSVPVSVCAALRLGAVTPNVNIINFTGRTLNVGPSDARWRIGNFAGSSGYATTSRAAISAVNAGGAGSIIALNQYSAVGDSGAASGAGFIVQPGVQTYMHEIFVYPFALTQAQALSMNAWLATEWGIS